MRTEEIKIYKYEELSDDAKKKAREWYREGNFDDSYWSECTTEGFNEQAQLMGFDLSGRDGKPSIYWRGFWSQGDGACFEGVWSACNCHHEKVADGWGDSPETKELKRIAKAFGEIAEKYPNSSFSVRHSGHYQHEFCTEFDCNAGDDDPPEEVLSKYRSPDDDPQDGDALAIDRWRDDFPEERLIETARDFMKWLYRQLEKEYEYVNSDEQVEDTIKANDYEFLENGSKY